MEPTAFPAMTESETIITWVILGLFILAAVTFPWGVSVIETGIFHIYYWLFPPKKEIDDSLSTSEQKAEIKVNCRRYHRKQNIYLFLFVILIFYLFGDRMWAFWNGIVTGK